MADENSDTLAGYVIRARQWLHETDGDASFHTPEFLKRLINSNYRRRCSQLVMAHEGYFKLVSTRDIVTDQGSYAWPNGFEKCQKMELVRTDGTTVPIIPHERHFTPNFPPGSGGDNYSPSWRMLSGGFVLEPAPNESVSDGLRIEYTGVPTLLTDDDDAFHADFPRSYDELVILDSVIAALDSEDLMETGQVKTILRQRQEFEWDWFRYVETRAVRSNRVTPFVPHYSDS